MSEIAEHGALLTQGHLGHEGLIAVPPRGALRGAFQVRFDHRDTLIRGKDFLHVCVSDDHKARAWAIATTRRQPLESVSWRHARSVLGGGRSGEMQLACVPQGGVLSPALCTLYLNRVDRILEREGGHAPWHIHGLEYARSKALPVR